MLGQSSESPSVRRSEGRWTFEASGFGYRTNAEASAVGPRSALLIRLEPAPVQLEGVYVSVVRDLVRRRMAAPSRVFAWDKAELEAAISPDIGSFVRTRGVAQFVACGGESAATDLPNCFWRRGRRIGVRLFIDDIEQLRAEGMSRLWSFDPRDLWSVEFLPGCRQLRIYTEPFMEQVEGGRVRLTPLLCVPDRRDHQPSATHSAPTDPESPPSRACPRRTRPCATGRRSRRRTRRSCFPPGTRKGSHHPR